MENRRIVLEGNVGTGKSTVKVKLEGRGHRRVIERGLMTEAVKSDMMEIPNNDSSTQFDLYVLLDLPEVICQQRLNESPESNKINEYTRSIEALTLYRSKYLEIAAPFKCHVVSSCGTPDQVADRVESIINGTKSGLILDINTLTEEDFVKLPLIIEGESKIVREVGPSGLDTDLNLVVIQLKPTIYSYTHNRAGIIEGTESLRLKCSKVFLDVVRSQGIPHAYIQISEKFALARRIITPPPIEVIVKAFHTGTPKHRYFAMEQSKVRQSHPQFPGFPIEIEQKYPTNYVRFDWRNPLKHPETQVRLSDEPLCDEHADFYIDTSKARVTAHKAFDAMVKFLGERGIVLVDICFMIDETGDMIWGEISQDCGRYQYVGKESLDKDVWRKGGSSGDVKKKFQMLYDILQKNPWKQTEEVSF